MFSGLLELEVVQLFSTNNLNDSTVYAFLKNCQNLKKLTLLGCSKVSNAGFRSFPVQSGITSLCLCFISIDDEGVEQVCRSCPDLREITFVGCTYVTDISIKHVCTHCPNLESLCVSTQGEKSNITDDGQKYVIHNSISLRSFEVSECPQVLELGVDLLAQCCYNLVELNLSGFKTITDDTLHTIAAHCTNLETVDVSKCFRVRGAGVNSLVTSCRRLRTLNVARCRFLWELNFVAFMHMESPFDKYLKRVEKLSNCSDELFAHISWEQALQTLTNGNTSHKGGSRARENFLNALTSSSIPRPRVHSELRVLNMGMCSRITDRCLFQIAAYCPDLRELNIKGCYNTTNQGISYISRGCEHLKLLNIATGFTKQMRLTDRSLVSIATHCKNLRQLNIEKNDLMSVDGLRYFCDHCPLPFKVSLTSKSYKILKSEILSTDRSANASKMVKSYDRCFSRGLHHLDVTLYDSYVDIHEFQKSRNDT